MEVIFVFCGNAVFVCAIGDKFEIAGRGLCVIRVRAGVVRAAAG